MPEKRPKTEKECQVLQRFCENVEYIIQTVVDTEYQAATAFLRAPDKMFRKAVIFPENAMVVGMFGDTGIKTALIQTAPGQHVDEYVKDAFKAYPNARYVIGVGACYAFKQSEYQLGDVLVSEKIADFATFEAKHDKKGKTVFGDMGETRCVDKHLHRTFCLGTGQCSKYIVTAVTESDSGRGSQVHAGTLISYPIRMNNKKIRDAFHVAREMAIGGEMEGGHLMRFVNSKQKLKKGAVMIKGVSNYGRGEKGKKWQFTATMAALHYIEQKLQNVQVLEEKGSFCSSPSVVFFVVSLLIVIFMFTNIFFL